MKNIRLLHAVGTRPNFMKLAAVTAAVRDWNTARPAVTFEQRLVHSGQHYDDLMSAVFFRDLQLPHPDHFLGAGSGSHAQQTAAVLSRLEPVLLAEEPDLVITYGDVNSTLAAALCAAKLGIPLAHVEAGLRSGDVGMPEELNRLLTDHLSQVLFTTERAADANLAREGVASSAVHFVGNVMIDTLRRLLPKARRGDALERLRLSAGAYGLITLHRASNVDDLARLRGITEALREISEGLPLIWPVHPRTVGGLLSLGLPADNIVLTEPLGYLDFLQVMDGAHLVLSDSGGVQAETTELGVPCLTLRETTEQPVTVSEGTTRLVDPCDGAAIVAAALDALASAPSCGSHPELWDGHAAERIVAVLAAVTS